MRNAIGEFVVEFQRRGQEPAFVFRRGYRRVEWSYAAVAGCAFRFARELEARGIAKGDRVMLWAENSAEWVAAFYGCMLHGAVVVPMDWAAAPDFVARVFAQTQSKLMVHGAGVAIPAGAAALEIEELEATVAARDDSAYAGAAVGRDDIAEIVFTSGTTAEPKGVVLTHGNILSSIAPIEGEVGKYLKWERFFHPIRFLDLLPLSHVFGQFMSIFIPQLIGGVVHFHNSLKPGEVRETIQRERISVLVAVPRMIESLKEQIVRDFDAAGRKPWLERALARAEGEHFVRRWWRFRRVHNRFGWKFWAVISGGAALDAQTEDFWRRLSFVVIQGYGMTETTSLVSLNHPFRVGKRSIGKVLPGREMKLDPKTGEILVRGANIARSYWQGGGMHAAVSDDGWLRTGDLGELDAEGNLYFKGRAKNVIVTAAGMKVYPQDLEQALRRQPEVRDAVVIPIARGGNAEPCAVLLLREAGDGKAPISKANEELAEFQRLRCWVVWPEEDFPRTATQKPRTNLLQQFAEAELRQAGGAPPPQGSLAEMIARITGKAPARLEAGARLEDDLNLSSLDRVELMAALEERYGVELDESQFGQKTTVAELERMLHHPASAGTSVRAGAATGGGAATEAGGHVYPRWPRYWPVTWLRAAAYWLLAWPATMLLAKPKVSGREKLAAERGPFLIVANHVTSADIGFVVAALPPRMRTRLAVAMQGEMLRAMRRPPSSMFFLLRWYEQLQYPLVVALFNVFPLPQLSGFRRSFEFAGELADRGYSVVIFPEGKRTDTGKMNPFRSGIGMLARRLGLPVLPVGISGLFELKQQGRHFAAPGTVRVRVGEPVRFGADEDEEEIARRLERIVRELSG